MSFIACFTVYVYTVYCVLHVACGSVGVPDRERQFFPLPQKITTLEPIHEIACGADHTLARGRSGVWSWGSGAGGKLGKSQYVSCVVVVVVVVVVCLLVMLPQSHPLAFSARVK